jgi:hypothetical protein
LGWKPAQTANKPLEESLNNTYFNCLVKTRILTFSQLNQIFEARTSTRATCFSHKVSALSQAQQPAEKAA